MQFGSENNALVEIALALSMAFFSLMVLTMMSMGVVQVHHAPRISLDNSGLMVQQANSSSARQDQSSDRVKIKPDAIAIYYNGQFFDAELNPLASAGRNSQTLKYLAVAPDLPMHKAISVRDQMGVIGLTVTTLNAAWLKTLKENLK